MSHWIQDTHMKKGALHKELGVKEGHKIPRAKLEKAAHRGGKVGRRARFAEELEGFHHKDRGRFMKEALENKKK